jgi:hypothetical protein
LKKDGRRKEGWKMKKDGRRKEGRMEDEERWKKEGRKEGRTMVSGNSLESSTLRGGRKEVKEGSEGRK